MSRVSVYYNGERGGRSLQASPGCEDRQGVGEVQACSGGATRVHQDTLFFLLTPPPPFGLLPLRITCSMHLWIIFEL